MAGSGVLRACALIAFAAAPAIAQEGAAPADASSLSCQQIAAESTALKAQMAEIGRAAVNQSAAQGQSQKTTAMGAAVAAALSPVVPLAGIVSHSIVKGGQAQASGAMAEAQGRMATAQATSARIQLLMKLQSEKCDASAAK